MARSLYFGADRVVTLTPGLKIELLKKGIPPGRLDLFPNGYNEAFFQLESGIREKTRTQYGWGNQFAAVYTGSLTEVTAVETIVRAGAALRARKDIRIDLFGYGQSKPKAVALAQELGLDNVHFHEAVPKTQIPAILAAADAGLMTLFRSSLIHIYFENKFIDYMGSRKPILASMEGVQADLIRSCGAGQVVGTFDHEALAKAIADAADHPDKCREMGEAGHRFVRTRLDQRDILKRYADVLEAVARREADRIPSWDPFQ
jgi:colanic acid biosynthesis glycosyl transferase WcaI